MELYAVPPRLRRADLHVELVYLEDEKVEAELHRLLRLAWRQQQPYLLLLPVTLPFDAQLLLTDQLDLAELADR